MARIRSVHPGLYTDENWAEVSIAARWLGVGIWTLCDDQGVFEWKPLQIKMRLFPADSADVATLLDELEDAGIVRPFVHGGRRYGACKNFCRYQRPRKPRNTFPLPAELMGFVASGTTEPSDDEDDGVSQKSELDALQAMPVPQKSELPPQREKEEGIGEEINNSAQPSAAPVGLAKDKSAPKPTAVGELKTVLSADLAHAIVEHRRLNKKALTAYAASLLAKQLAKFADPNAAAAAMLERGWQGLKPEWVPHLALASTATTAQPIASLGAYIQRETPQWDAWCSWYRKHKGRSPPTDKNGGWHFPSEWPPQEEDAA